MENQNIPSSSPASKPPTPPPPPRMFTGKQGFFLIIVLTLAVAGWVLYLNKWENKSVSEKPQEEASVEQEQQGTKPYTPIAKTYLGGEIPLPNPDLVGEMTLEEALASRRSRRAYSSEPLSQESLSQMLWAAQGVTSEFGGRTAPSARSIYPYNLYVIVRDVSGIEPGLYHYIAENHSIRPLISSDNLLTGENEQPAVSSAPAVLVYGAIYDKTREKFAGDSAVQVTLQESGHIGQNVYLQAEASNLATNVVGGFNADQVKSDLQLPADETVVYLQPFGNRGEEEVAEEEHK